MVNVGIVGGTGYTGVELMRLLSMHPEARIGAITSRAEEGVSVGDIFPSLRGHVDLTFEKPSLSTLIGCDVVFFISQWLFVNMDVNSHPFRGFMVSLASWAP